MRLGAPRCLAHRRRQHPPPPSASAAHCAGPAGAPGRRWRGPAAGRSRRAARPAPPGPAVRGPPGRPPCRRAPCPGRCRGRGASPAASRAAAGRPAAPPPAPAGGSAAPPRCPAAGEGGSTLRSSWRLGSGPQATGVTSRLSCRRSKSSALLPSGRASGRRPGTPASGAPSHRGWPGARRSSPLDRPLEQEPVEAGQVAVELVEGSHGLAGGDAEVLTATFGVEVEGVQALAVGQHRQGGELVRTALPDRGNDRLQGPGGA